MKYSDLVVWQKAMNLVESAYQSTQSFPRHELFGLASQIRRAAVSIPANIAEGQGRKSTGAYVNHLSIASGSLMELETCIQIAERLGYTTHQRVGGILKQCQEIGRMLNGLISSLNPES